MITDNLTIKKGFSGLVVQPATEQLARLIKAAPKLLNAAEAAVNRMAEAGIGFNETGLREAIAEAGGKCQLSAVEVTFSTLVAALDALRKLAEMHDKGQLTDAEWEAARQALAELAEEGGTAKSE